ncbi:16S rRNA (cytidine(1402)-2'-O)-methyltransferase [Candidatus Woesearchaeota archaeon]|nr:16S rRNA (cytidine(1402)-2'-O)-methyltransferase [Candidatus Woesearchaeota archaeon]
MPLYIVATPIGNLDDVSFRAVKTLEEVDLILAEDTRRTSILLNHYKVKNKVDSFNDFNKEKKTPTVIELLNKNKKIAIVSDSGTPGISDPGFYLVRECVKNDIKIVPVPGANALITALVSSGFATDKFMFLGFLSKKENQLKKSLLEIKNNNITTIFYESPYRIEKTLKLINQIIPDKKICVARELTKKFEEFIRGTASEILEKKPKFKGEITVVIGKD